VQEDWDRHRVLWVRIPASAFHIPGIVTVRRWNFNPNTKEMTKLILSYAGSDPTLGALDRNLHPLSPSIPHSTTATLQSLIQHKA
jgi:hypothetical protein